jgi:hypothetical protein
MVRTAFAPTCTAATCSGHDRKPGTGKRHRPNPYGTRRTGRRVGLGNAFTVPDKATADQPVRFIVTGDRAVINYSPQQLSGGTATVNVAAQQDPVPQERWWQRWRKQGLIIGRPLSSLPSREYSPG